MEETKKLKKILKLMYNTIKCLNYKFYSQNLNNK